MEKWLLKVLLFFSVQRHRGKYALSLAALFVAALFSASLLPPFANAQAGGEVVVVTSDIIGEQTWEGGKTYVVQGSRVIKNGASLYIEAGAVVKIADFIHNNNKIQDGTLIVKGRLEARGTPTQPVYFTDGEDTSPEVGSYDAQSSGWLGIDVTSSGEAVLDHAEIRRAPERGIRVHSSLGGGGRLTARNCVFRDNKTGILVVGGEALIEHCRFYLHQPEHATGIKIRSLLEPVQIRGNEFRGNHSTHYSTGLSIEPADHPQAPLLETRFNTFYRTGYGVQIDNEGHVLRGNNFINNAYGVCMNKVPPVQLAPDLRFNYWNCSTGPSLLDGGWKGSGDKILHHTHLLFEPWSPSELQYCPFPPQVLITSPAAGETLYEEALLQVHTACPNASEVFFTLGDEEIARFDAASGPLFNYTLSAEDTEKEHAFTATVVTWLGEESESTRVFTLSPSVPSPPGSGPENGEENGHDENGENGSEGPVVPPGEKEGENGKKGEEEERAPLPAPRPAKKEKNPAEGSHTTQPDAEKDNGLKEDKKEEGSALEIQQGTEGEGEAEKLSGEDKRDISQLPPVYFLDVDHDHPAWEAVTYLHQKGIVTGMGEMIFAPELALNRAQAAALLARAGTKMKQTPQAAGQVSFSDLEEGSWYAPHVHKAAALGLLKGYEDGSFRPLASISSAEFAVILDRLCTFAPNPAPLHAGPAGSIFPGTTSPEKTKTRQVLEKTPFWAKGRVGNLLYSGIIGEAEISWFEPALPLNRGEGAILLYRAISPYELPGD